MAKKSTYRNFNHQRIDKLFQNRLRMAILAAISNSEEVDFVSLKNAVNATEGNLSAQIRLLESAGLITVNKIFVARRPQTNLALTDKGTRTLLQFKNIINDWFDLE